jgi:uncharacterized Fe-S cluster protein YjdI
MTEERMETKDREYTNGEITVKWQPSKCIHVTTCYRELIEVFNPRKRPWVNMQGAPTDEIIRVVKLCPTEALTFRWNDESGVNEQPEKKPVEAVQDEKKIMADIKVMKDGPLLVKGIFKIVGSDGVEMKQMRMVSFCRCGNSGKMPFCDGTHRKIGFSAD